MVHISDLMIIRWSTNTLKTIKREMGEWQTTHNPIFSVKCNWEIGLMLDKIYLAKNLKAQRTFLQWINHLSRKMYSLMVVSSVTRVRLCTVFIVFCLLWSYHQFVVILVINLSIFSRLLHWYIGNQISDVCDGILKNMGENVWGLRVQGCIFVGNTSLTPWASNDWNYGITFIKCWTLLKLGTYNLKLGLILLPMISVSTQPYPTGNRPVKPTAIWPQTKFIVAHSVTPFEPKLCKCMYML